MFMTAIELEVLTGYRRPSAQRAWLSRNRIPHFVAASGRPVVVREALNVDQRRLPPANGPKAQPRLRLAATALPPRR